MGSERSSSLFCFLWPNHGLCRVRRLFPSIAVECPAESGVLSTPAKDGNRVLAVLSPPNPCLGFLFLPCRSHPILVDSLGGGWFPLSLP